jgi:hypothetical protein
MKYDVPPETTVTLAEIGEAVVLPMVMPMIVDCVAAGATYTLAAEVVAFLRKKFLKVFAMKRYPYSLLFIYLYQPKAIENAKEVASAATILS